MLTEEFTGVNSPDPLRFAFARKMSPHAGGETKPIAKEKFQSVWRRASSFYDEVGQKRAIYVHIPFCRTLCSYCRFFQNVAKPEVMQAYTEVLIREIEQSANSIVASQPFDALYIGGGTPTDLSAQQIRQILAAINSHFSFSADAELTLEGRLSEFGDGKIEAALESGITRFSFGVQSFNTQIRQSLKRIDSGEVVHDRLVDLVNRYSKATIVIDLMYGLPYQTEANWREDLAKFADTGAHGIDLYQLIEMKGTGLEASIRTGKMPSALSTPEKASLYQIGCDYLDGLGLLQLSCNHWATNHQEQSRYNSFAKSGATILPFGSGAGGSVGGVNLMHHRQLNQYIESVARGEKPIAMLIESDVNAVWVNWLKQSFDKGIVDISCANLSEQQVTKFHQLCNAWVVNGLAEKKYDSFVLTLAGRFWNVTMCQAMIQWLSND